MTVLEAYREAVKELASAGVENPEREAELLTKFLTGVSLWEVHVGRYGEVEVSWEEMRDLVSRRARREPLQLILGSWEFYGREFALREGVFIPRPETEVLVDEVLLLLSDKAAGSTGLEVGVGSGVISVSLLSEVRNLAMVGVDVSGDAVSLTEENARTHGVSERLTLVCGDAREVDYGRRFDFVVSNPPYVAEGDIEGLMPEVSRYEPVRALAGGRDGLSFIRDLLVMSCELLRPGGFVAFEFGYGQLEGVERAVEETEGLVLSHVRMDHAGTPRVAVAVRK